MLFGTDILEIKYFIVVFLKQFLKAGIFVFAVIDLVLHDDNQFLVGCADVIDPVQQFEVFKNKVSCFLYF